MSLKDFCEDKLSEELLHAVDMECSALFNLSCQSSNESSDPISKVINFNRKLENSNTLLDPGQSQLPPDNKFQNRKKECPEKNKGSKIIKKGQRYKPLFKEKVLKYAVKHTFKETATKFNINCNTLTEWAREYKRLLQLKKSTTARPGSTLKTDVTCNLTDTLTQRLQVSAEAKFIQWLRRKRLDGLRVRREEVHAAGLMFLQTCEASSGWFSRWVQRLSESSAMTLVPKADKPIFYPNSFKLEVALYAKEYTKKAAAMTFCVSSRRLYDWCEREDDIADSDRCGVGEVVAARRHVESQLRVWFEKQCATGNRPKSRELVLEARALYAACGLPYVKCSNGWLEKIQKRLNLRLSHSYDDTLLMWVLSQLDDNRSLSVHQVTSMAKQIAVERHASSFKCSKGWTLRFLKRHSHLLQCSSVRLTDLPAPAMAQAQLFCRAIQQRVSAASLTDKSVGCMDEVPITFAYPTGKVQTPRLLRQAGLETAHAVVLLAATSDGCLLPPAVVLKGQRVTQTFQAEEVSLLVLYHAKGGVDVETLRCWCQHIWLRCVVAPSVLVVDSFSPHQNEELAAELSAGCCYLGVIPAGCALHLHPCAFNLSQRFQEAIQEEWLNYITENRSRQGQPKASPAEEVILTWVIKAYLALREDMYSIKSSFQLSGLTKPTWGPALEAGPQV